ncbi:MAG TPA: hypothetical protein VF867_07410 [Arthrobacter sp.]
MTENTMTANDTRTATVEVNLVAEDGVRLPEKRTLNTISIHHARALTRFLHEGCRYADADQIHAEDFGRLTFGELNYADLGPCNRAGLDVSVGWILDDLLELLMDEGWDLTESDLQLDIH